MACDKCNFKGYRVDTYMANNKEYASTRVCPHCNDLKAYSDYIKSKYSVLTTPPKLLETESEDNVIYVDFKDKKISK